MVFKSKRSLASSLAASRRQSLKRAVEKEMCNGWNVNQVDICKENLIKEEIMIVPNINDAASSFCVLCLHKCPPESSIELNASECRDKLENTLCLRIDFENSTICRTCWKLVETFSIFRVCCQKAVSCSERNTGLLYNEEVDSWLCTDTMKAIDVTFRAIQSRIEFIESNELTAEHLTVKIEIDDSAQYLESIEKGANATNNDKDVQEAGSQDEPETATVDQTNTSCVVDVKVCKKCWKWFSSNDEYSLHTQQCIAPEGEKPSEVYYNCNICSAAFKKIRTLKFHLNKHKGVKSLKCRKQCDEHFYDDVTRLRHESSCGLFEKGSKLICPTCGILVEHCHLSSHLAYHGKAKNACSICGKMFNERALRRHMLVHSGIRNHLCAVCGKAFKSSYAARIHLRIHTQEKPFICSVCGCAFPYKCSLQAHVKRFHGQHPAVICD